MNLKIMREPIHKLATIQQYKEWADYYSLPECLSMPMVADMFSVSTTMVFQAFLKLKVPTKKHGWKELSKPHLLERIRK